MSVRLLLQNLKQVQMAVLPIGDLLQLSQGTQIPLMTLRYVFSLQAVHKQLPSPVRVTFVRLHGICLRLDKSLFVAHM